MSNTTIITPSNSSTMATVSCMDYAEEFSGVHVKNRVTSRAEMRTCMQGRAYYGISHLASMSREALSSKDGANAWATCGKCRPPHMFQLR